MAMSCVCTHCGGSDIEYDQARGDAVCTKCGSVLEDNIIVSEVTFVEQSSGSSSVIGQFVSTEGSKHPLSGTGFYHGLGKDSREATLQQAKKRLTNLGQLLKLNQHCIDSAFMFFKMALQMNLTRGRKSSIIDTACLYLVCRSEGTPHLLLDFSDVLQINVYALGRAYLRLSTALHINPPAIDPCLYIHRFAHKLELGEKTHEVSMTALRLVARMKRDWIHHGRRPAGLCGAALLVAARLHNFNRTVREVARVVKLSEGTIRKRLGDFKDTPSSRLTIEEFLKIDLEQEHDPPSFTESKKRAKQPSLSAEDDVRVHCSKESGEVVREDVEGEGDAGKGFGGIKLASVHEIIAKARFNESYLHVNLGLSESLDDLSRHFENEGREGMESCSLGWQEELDLTGIDDEEIDQMLLSEEEVKIKTRLWFAENGDYLKEQEVRRERLAALKADKEREKKNRPHRSRKTKAVAVPATSAGEAIERMLVERRISTKINYDVLRDLTKNLSDQGTSAVPTGSSAGAVATHVASSGHSLSISRCTPITGRLPSLTTRKRTFSALSSALNSFSASKYGRVAQQSKTSNSVCFEATPGEPFVGGECEADSGVVEESGPVEYVDDDEGMDDHELEQLAYEGDPLLHSDYEDEGDFCEDSNNY